jgi:hypothetical protein
MFIVLKRPSMLRAKRNRFRFARNKYKEKVVGL